MNIEDCNKSDSIKVFVRVRPPADNLDHNASLVVLSPTTLLLRSKSNPKEFTFDHVVDENASQETVFESVGKRIVDGCIEGYNGTIFAYGQTGSGKTFTMLGNCEDFTYDFQQKLRGIIPRSLEYLFQLINDKVEKHGKKLEFLCKCSFLEIYHEQIYDLLNPNATSPLQLRESLKRGIFVDRITETSVSSASHALEVLKQGWNLRHVASTSMNRESSRSHAVFTVCIESKDRTEDVTKVRQSVLNLVDLAGSERQRDTGTTGARLKEAGCINKSLSVFGNVIMALVDINKGKSRHVPYRDSKLTFLLRDSVGGNAKTYLIANVHPSASCVGETLSTLYFAQRAKMIKNRARVNEDTQGDVIALQNEIRRLKVLLLSSKPDGRLDDNEEHSDSYEEKFLQMMEIWKQDEVEINELNTKLTSMQNTVSKLEKALFSTRMVIKFRDSTINKLTKKDKDSSSDIIQQLNKENEMLNEQICGLPQAAMQLHRIGELKRTIERLQSLPNAQAFYQFSTKRKNDLIEEYKKIVNLRGSGLPSSEYLNNKKISEDFKTKLTNLEVEHEELKKVGEKEKEILRMRINLLNEELSSAKFEKKELDKMLKASQDGARVQLQHLNMIHENTIRIITTPKKSSHTPLGGKRPANIDLNSISPRKLLKSLDGDSFKENDSQDENVHPGQFLDDVYDIDDDVSKIAYKIELESMKEAQTKVEERAQSLENECANLRAQLKVKQEKVDSTNKILDSYQSEAKSKEDKLLKSIEDYKKKLSYLTEDHRLKCEEVEDLRITLASADRELAEKKSSLSCVTQSKQEELSTLRQKICDLKEEDASKSLQIETMDQQIQNLEEENDKTITELDFTRDRLAEADTELQTRKESIISLESQLKLSQAQLEESRKLFEGSQLERDVACQELTEANEQLRAEVVESSQKLKKQDKLVEDLHSHLEANEKTIKNNKNAMSSLLDQVKELQEALSLRDAAEDQLRVELEEHKAKLGSLSQNLEKAEKQNQDYCQQLEISNEKNKESEGKLRFQIENLEDDLSSLSDHFTTITNDLAEKESLLEEERLKNSSVTEELEKQLEEANRALTETKLNLKASLEEKKKCGEQGEEICHLRISLQEQSQQYDDLHHSYNEVMRQYHVGRDMISQLEKKLSSQEAKISELEIEQKSITDKMMAEQASLEAENHVKLVNVTAMLEDERSSKSDIVRELEETKQRLEESLKEITSCNDINKLLTADVARLRDMKDDRFSKTQQLETEIERLKSELSLAKEKLTSVTEQRDKLAAESGKLAGHSNHLQKIHYMEKLMKDRCQLSDENKTLQAKLARMSDQLRKYETASIARPRSLSPRP